MLPSPSLSFRRRLRALTLLHALPLLLYLALALLMTWPLALQPGTAVPGSGYDSWQNMWNMWWLRQALLHGDNPYFTPYLYYPHGASLLLHTLNPLNFIISLPVHALFGLVAAFNFVVLFSLTVSSYTAYLLARDVLDERRQTIDDRPPTAEDSTSTRRTTHDAALVAGAIYAFSGYLLAQVMGGHTHMMAAWLLPLVVLALRRAARAPGVKSVVLAGVLIALNQLADWQYFLFALIWGGWYALWLGLAWWWERRGVSGTRERARVPAASFPKSALAVLAATALALLLVLPLVLPTAQLAAQVPSAATEGGANFRLEHSADLADFFIPSQLHPLWGRVAEQLQAYKAETHIQNKTVYLGLVTLILAALGLRRARARFWLLSALVFGVLAMGPQLQLFGHISSLPLPGALLFELPFVRVFRYPVRFAVLTMLALSVLAALGTERLLKNREAGSAQQPSQRSRRALRTTLVVLLIVLDNLTTPFPMVGVYVPPIYAEMARDTEPYAILEAPFYFRSSPVYMLFQAVHGKPLMGGYLSRTLPYPVLDQIPLLRQFAFAQPAPDIIAQDSASIAASVFSYFNIRYLLLHSDGGALRYNELMLIARAAAGGATPLEQGATVVAPDARAASKLPRTWGRAPLEPAGNVLVYRVVPPADPRPFLGVGAGWSEPRTSAAGGLERQIQGEEATLLIYSAAPRTVTLDLDLRSAGTGRLAFSLGGQALPAQDLRAGEQQIRVVFDVGVGATSLLLRPEGAAVVAVRRVDVQ